jgi:hypothetical protein
MEITTKLEMLNGLLPVSAKSVRQAPRDGDCDAALVGLER